MNFSSTTLNQLKYYVYIYSHPKTKEIFYVGKGKGNRVFAHLKDDGDSQKASYLKRLKEQGLKPHIEILIHGLENEKTALRVEASIIDLIGIKNLTNRNNGYKSSTFGRMSIEQVNSVYSTEEVMIEEPSVLIRINKLFRYTMSAIELYDATRGIWKVNPKRAENAKLAFAVFQGVIQEVYEVLHWYKAGSTFTTRIEETQRKERYEFIGNVAKEEIRNKYRNKSVGHYFNKGNSNPIMYVNI